MLFSLTAAWPRFGSAQTATTAQPDSNATQTMTVRFRYAGAGLGADPTIAVVLHRGAEANVISRIIIEAVQEFGFTIALAPNKPLPLRPGIQYKTAMIALADSLVRAYNSANTANPLQSDVKFYANAEVQYDLANQTIAFRVALPLSKKAALTPIEPYNRPYVQNFFPSLLLRTIRNKLDRAFPPR